MPKYKGLIASSQDPTQIANTVKGIVLGFSALIILLAQQFFHLQLTASDIGSLAEEIGICAGAVWTLWGLIMKIITYFGTQSPTPPQA